MKKVILAEIKKYERQVTVAKTVGNSEMYARATQKLERAERAYDRELEREGWGA